MENMSSSDRTLFHIVYSTTLTRVFFALPNAAEHELPCLFSRTLHQSSKFSKCTGKLLFSVAMLSPRMLRLDVMG